MPRGYSDNAKRNMYSTQAGELPLVLLEITHADLGTPVRVTNDNADIVSNGNTFTAVAFGFVPPDDLAAGEPRATLAIDNVGKELVQWLELSGGGRGSQCRIMHVQRSAPDTIEWEITMNLSGITMTTLRVSGELSFDELLNIPAVAVTYNLQTAPAMF